MAASKRKGNHMTTNLERANWADKAVLAFREQTGCEHEDSLGGPPLRPDALGGRQKF